MTVNQTEYDKLIQRRSELRVQLSKFYREGDTSRPDLHEKKLINELDDINLTLMKSKVVETVPAEQFAWK